MRRPDFSATGTLRPVDREDAGGDGGGDTPGFRAAIPGDGRRALWGALARLEGVVPATGLALGAAGALPGRWERASRTGRADGGALGPGRGGRAVVGPRFDAGIAPNGYAWWYVDAISDDQRHGITLIALLGNVFSPWYASARARSGAADPLDHCGLNVALYGPGASLWTLTERRREHVHRESDRLALGPSRVQWNGECLTFHVDETTSPLPSRVRGVVRVHPSALANHRVALDAQERHHWQPIAPSARVEVAFEQPGLSWSGTGYVDSNDGRAPLEDAFSGWSWSRAGIAGGTSVLYDVLRRDAPPLTLALAFDAAGAATELPAPPRASLPGTRWGIARTTRADAHCTPSVLRTLEDTPFYARSLLDTRVHGSATTAVHESLSLDRFRSAWVRLLLPFRLPRALRRPNRGDRECR
jgi:carotenoid 1,2-hydratase